MATYSECDQAQELAAEHREGLEPGVLILGYFAKPVERMRLVLPCRHYDVMHCKEEQG